MNACEEIYQGRNGKEKQEILSVKKKIHNLEVTAEQVRLYSTKKRKITEYKCKVQKLLSSSKENDMMVIRRG